VQCPEKEEKGPGNELPGQVAGLPATEVSSGRASRDQIDESAESNAKQRKQTYLHKD
jgi:hypothetical protein